MIAIWKLQVLDAGFSFLKQMETFSEHWNKSLSVYQPSFTDFKGEMT